jgi:hypothetical protein
MSYKYDYKKYVEWCNQRGNELFIPEYIQLFRDETLYSASQISNTTGIHKETALRWFRNLLLINQSASNTYKAKGSNIKHVLFNRPNVINPLKKKYPDFFNE